MPKTSAGLVMLDPDGRVLLVHPGGPYFTRRDTGVWSIPKGMSEPGEELLATARREFEEELGLTPPDAADLYSLGRIRQSGGKTVTAWVFLGTWDPTLLRSNLFELEWPPRSGTRRTFPEVDRAEFFDPVAARERIVPAQYPLVERALEWLSARSTADSRS